MISLGSVTLHVENFTGWSYPTFGSMVSVLSDGTSVDNEVYQSAAVPRLRASLRGHSLDSSEVATLTGYNGSKEIVTFSDDDESTSDTGFGVHVLDFQFSRDRSHPWLYEYSLELVTAPDEESS